MPSISVLMSVYKEPIEWLRQSIDSILNQSFTDFEFIIVCDNPAYEEGKQLLKEYAKADNRVVLIFNEENIGLTKSLNKGLAIAKGEYIARMDADDISLPYRFEVQVAFMEANPDCVASGAFARIIDDKGKEGSYWQTETEWNALKSTALFSSPILHPAAIFKREINGRPVMYDETKKFAQDYALWATLIGNHVILNIDKVLLLYRQTGNQISSGHNAEQSNSAIETQAVLFNELGLYSTPQIQEAIAVITKDLTASYDLKVLSDLLSEFVSGNNQSSSVNIDIVKNKVFQYYCLYLPHRVGVVRACKYALALSKSIGAFAVRPMLSMSYHCLQNKKLS